MIVHNHRAMAAFAVTVALSAAVAAALGVFARGDGSYETVTSVRGVTYAMATSGVYAFNAQRIVAEGVGWDVFTLFVAVPVMLAAAGLVAGGSFRGRLLALGLFGYFFYQYLEYAMTWAFGPLFPLFIAIFGASLVGLVWFGASVADDGIADRFGEEFPGRPFAVASVLMAVLLVVMWTGRIAAGLAGDLAAAGLHGETTARRAGSGPRARRPGGAVDRGVGMAWDRGRARPRVGVRRDLGGDVGGDRRDARVGGHPRGIVRAPADPDLRRLHGRDARARGPHLSTHIT